MNEPRHGPRDDDEPTLPPSFEARLRGAFPRVRVPPEVDAAVLRLARGRLRYVRSRRRIRVIFAAAAAIVVLAVVLRRGAERAPELADGSTADERNGAIAARESASGPARRPGDFDGSGRLDILDAFLIARRLRDGGTIPGEWDLTGDGSVDDGDVRHLALLAVR
jgi:hypothetical protein